MEQLADSLRVAASANDPGAVLLNAAKAWAAHSLDTYRDGLLRQALAISAALADFNAELERPR